MSDLGSTKRLDLEEEKENNVVSFEPKLITGGKGPPNSTEGDWLTPLETGTIFFVQSKQNPMDFNLGLFKKEKVEGRVIVLVSPMLPKEIYVNPIRFCNTYVLYHELGIMDLIQEEDNSHAERNPLEGADQVERPEGEQV